MNAVVPVWRLSRDARSNAESHVQLWSESQSLSSPGSGGRQPTSHGVPTRRGLAEIWLELGQNLEGSYVPEQNSKLGSSDNTRPIV